MKKTADSFLAYLGALGVITAIASPLNAQVLDEMDLHPLDRTSLISMGRLTNSSSVSSPETDRNRGPLSARLLLGDALANFAAKSGPEGSNNLSLWSPLAETSVRDLNPPAKVIGSLGVPLGKRLVIEGVFAERVMLDNPLLVSRVDGNALTQPVAIEVQGKVQIEKGTQYRLEGYESGAFVGPPTWTLGNRIAQQPFQFRSFFFATRVIQPPPE